jgi:hypothetical protein
MTFARVRAIIFVAVLFLTAAAVVVMAISRDSQTEQVQASACPSGLVLANVELPERHQVTINVFNGTKTVGLAEDVGNDLKVRGFVLKSAKTAAGNKQYPEDVAVIVYGPEAVGAAQLVRANFLLEEERAMQFELERKGPEVDIIIGGQFQQLATSTEVNQSIAALGRPDPPPGTCAATT